MPEQLAEGPQRSGSTILSRGCLGADSAPTTLGIGMEGTQVGCLASLHPERGQQQMLEKPP